MTRRLIAPLVLAALLLTGAGGCTAKSARSNVTDAPDGASVTTATAEATASAGSEATVPAGSKYPSSPPAADAAAIQKELSAIQKELDSMSMPSDSDFDSIEGDLR